MSKYSFDFKANDYKTPKVLYQMALAHFKIEKFDIDTCCTDENIPAKKYFKNGLNDGLKEKWSGFCWCNPPYNKCADWVRKAYIENRFNKCKIAMLIPVRTETVYWHNYILENKNVTIKWLKKGYKFLNRDNEEMGVFKNAIALVYFNELLESEE